MFLKSVKISNFRKYGLDNHEIGFVDAQNYYDAKEGKKVNVASTTTLIVGKNNAGKTTIIQVMDRLINGEKNSADDFNYFYLKRIYERYKADDFEELPIIRVELKIGLNKGNDDYVTNIVPFMSLKDVNEDELTIIANYELRNEEKFKEDVKKMLKKTYKDEILFSKFLEILNNSEFKVKYYNEKEQEVEKFHIRDLISLVKINANNITGEGCLSGAYNKIIKYRYEEQFQDEKEALEDKMIEINNTITNRIEKNHTKAINASINSVLSKDKVQVSLSSDLSFSKLLTDLIKYEYIEKGNYIPENQFGLGYTNLMMIIANLIDYIEKYPDIAFNSKINLVCIEEPETFMHPQMQELFINHINNAISTLLSIKHRNVNSQLIITTHSAHILNSKIHNGGSFNNINYVSENGNYASIVKMNDSIIAPNGNINDDDFNFIKKHIKFKFSELFFADAAILVEGISEYNLLPYYIDKDNTLNKYYITIININGAHGLVYKNLIKTLGIPTVIITDLDIERNEEETKNFKQMNKNSIAGKLTTNKTIIAFNNGNKEIDQLGAFIQEDNIYVAFQNKDYLYYPTSFEEAFILKNYANPILNEVLEKIKPQIYKKIIGKENDLKNNRRFSYKWQKKLSDSKSSFSNELLYEIITQNENIPILPKYIEKAFDFIKNEIKGR